MKIGINHKRQTKQTNDNDLRQMIIIAKALLLQMMETELVSESTCSYDKLLKHKWLKVII